MNYSCTLTSAQCTAIVERYRAFQVPATNDYTLFRAKINTTTLTIFRTAKLLIQGSAADELVANLQGILPEALLPAVSPKASLPAQSFATEARTLIGTDEVGTGDAFGGIVVAGSYVTKDAIPDLIDLGVRDSKLLTDVEIERIASRLLALVPYKAILLPPVKYNYLTSVKHYNMNKLKALLHNEVILALEERFPVRDGVIIDGFVSQPRYFDYLKDRPAVARDARLEDHGESKHVAIAAASVIARHYFLQHMDSLSSEIEFELPKGAGTPVDHAIALLAATHGERFFEKIAKVNFKNFSRLHGKA